MTARQRTPLSRRALWLLAIGGFAGVVVEVCLAGLGIWAASGGNGAPGAFLLFTASGVLGALTLFHTGIVLVGILRGTRHHPSRTGLCFAWTHVLAMVIGVAVIGLIDPANSGVAFIALLAALNLAALQSATGKNSRIWPSPIDNHPAGGSATGATAPPSDTRVRLVADVCPARLVASAAAGDQQLPCFVANLQSTRAWLRSVLCYSPQAGCWVLYWPDPAHHYLIEGPHNPLRHTPADSRLAQQWAADCLDTQAELEAFFAGRPLAMARQVTSWLPIELTGRHCWVPLFTTDRPWCLTAWRAPDDISRTRCPCAHQGAAA